MNMLANFGTISSPKNEGSAFLAYEAECKDVLGPVLDHMIDTAVKAGWQRRTVASALMFLAAQHVSASPS